MLGDGLDAESRVVCEVLHSFVECSLTHSRWIDLLGCGRLGWLELLNWLNWTELLWLLWLLELLEILGWLELLWLLVLLWLLELLEVLGWLRKLLSWCLVVGAWGLDADWILCYKWLYWNLLRWNWLG